MLVYRMVAKIKDSKVWAKIKSKDSDHRGFKVDDQIIKGFMVYKSDKPNIFTVKNESGEQYEGTMEEVKRKIDAYWIKRDQDIVKQKMYDNISDLFGSDSATYRGYKLEVANKPDPTGGKNYRYWWRVSKDGKQIRVGASPDKNTARAVAYNAINELTDSKTKDKAPKHPRYRIKDDKLFRLRSAIKKVRSKDASAPKEFNELKAWQNEAMHLGYRLENNQQRGLWVAYKGNQEVGTFVPTRGGQLYIDTYTKGSADRKTKDNVDKEQLIAELIKGGSNPLRAKEKVEKHLNYLERVYPDASLKEKMNVLLSIKDSYTKGSADRKTRDESFKLEKNCSAIWDPTFKSLEVYDDTKDILIKRIGSNVTSKEDAMQKAKRIIDNYKPASSLTKEQKLNRSGYYTANDALPYEKNGRNLMEWENGDLSLEELKRKLAVAVEERDEYVANAVRQDIQRRQKTQDAFTKEQIKSYMDQLYKTPKDNLIQEYKRVTKVSTPEGNSKDVLISGLLEAKFGKGYDKILFANDKFTGDPQKQAVAIAMNKAGKSKDAKTKDMNGYVCFYKNQRKEVYANTSYEAQQIAAKEFKAKKTYEVTVMLAEKNGEQVVHRAVDAKLKVKDSVKAKFSKTKDYIETEETFKESAKKDQQEKEKRAEEMKKQLASAKDQASDLKSKIIAFFKANPNPDDSVVHAFAEKEGINPHELETEIYKLVTEHVGMVKGN